MFASVSSIFLWVAFGHLEELANLEPKGLLPGPDPTCELTANPLRLVEIETRRCVPRRSISTDAGEDS